jgi:branched-subunit amino acid aminotransferase/4-amino-4-deoxychorismate lyase
VVQIRDVMLAEVYSADELFLVNSVIGVWSVRELADRRWQDHPFAKHLRTELTRGEPR